MPVDHEGMALSMLVFTFVIQPDVPSSVAELTEIVALVVAVLLVELEVDAAVDELESLLLELAVLPQAAVKAANATAHKTGRNCV